MHSDELMKRANDIANLRTHHNKYSKILKDLESKAEILEVIEASEEQINDGIKNVISHLKSLEAEMKVLMGIE